MFVFFLNCEIFVMYFKMLGEVLIVKLKFGVWKIEENIVVFVRFVLDFFLGFFSVSCGFDVLLIIWMMFRFCIEIYMVFLCFYGLSR